MFQIQQRRLITSRPSNAATGAALLGRGVMGLGFNLLSPEYEHRPVSVCRTFTLSHKSTNNRVLWHFVVLPDTFNIPFHQTACKWLWQYYCLCFHARTNWQYLLWVIMALVLSLVIPYYLSHRHDSAATAVLPIIPDTSESIKKLKENTKPNSSNRLHPPPPRVSLGLPDCREAYATVN
jgi:hypothetical protein